MHVVEPVPVPVLCSDFITAEKDQIVILIQPLYKLALSDGVTMQLTVRSENADVSELVASNVG